ncbi:response regulator [Deinococcus aestuarii]|uniref:response regulator n=1 Tax=Deinococcus aestuarii TaxID=2774531 RepID=UPI001FEA99F7|nr:response regulator [Deinococcus aestuarii]
MGSLFEEEVDMPGHLLIVEDQPNDVELARAALALSQVGCEVSVARDGTEALDLLRQPGPCPNLILLDLNLPGVGGQEVLTAVRANPAWRHVPVVIFTTSDEPQDRAACAAAGADEYVLKPGGFGELIDLFNSLGQRWLTAEHRT